MEISSQNPTLRGVETTGGELEGFRLLRVAFEPDANVVGGCNEDSSGTLNGSHMDIVVLVRSRVDIQVSTIMEVLLTKMAYFRRRFGCRRGGIVQR